MTENDLHPAVRGEWIALAPRDTVLVRDGRQFDAGVDSTAESTLPGPATVAGAALSAYGEEPAEVRGPLLGRHDGYAWRTYLPAPLDLVRADDAPDSVSRLAAKPVDAVTDLIDAPPCWLVGHGDPVGGWISGRALSRYLRGELVRPGDTVDIGDVELLGEDAGPVRKETRVGLARGADRVVHTGLLYQAIHLRPRDGVNLLVECVPKPEKALPAPQGPVPLGGRGRLADVATVTDASWPTGPDSFPDGKVLAYLATPAIWPHGWRFPDPARGRLIAAAVGPAQPVAMASPRAGDKFGETRQLRWAVPAGSVFLLEFSDAEAARHWACAVHGTAYAPGGVKRLRTAGFGVILTGVW